MASDGHRRSVSARISLIARYLFIAIKRVYREPSASTVLKGILLLVLTLIVDTIVNLTAFGLTLLLV